MPKCKIVKTGVAAGTDSIAQRRARLKKYSLDRLIELALAHYPEDEIIAPVGGRRRALTYVGDTETKIVDVLEEIVERIVAEELAKGGLVGKETETHEAAVRAYQRVILVMNVDLVIAMRKSPAYRKLEREAIAGRAMKRLAKSESELALERGHERQRKEELDRCIAEKLRCEREAVAAADALFARRACGGGSGRKEEKL